MSMTRTQASERLCEIKETVLEHMEDRVASDCLCGHNPGSDENYREEGDTIAFIAHAVAAEIAREKGQAS